MQSNGGIAIRFADGEPQSRNLFFLVPVQQVSRLRSK